MKELRRTAEEVIAAWKRSETMENEAELEAVLNDLVRRQVGFLLRRDGPLAPLDPSSVSADLMKQWGTDLDGSRREELASIITNLATSILVDEEPQEVTRWLWIWDRDAPNSKDVEEQLFSAIQDDLRRRLGRILRQQRFGNLHHRIEQDDLVSDLYIKLAKTKIPRLPENRRQFFGLVDKAILGILLDMQKAVACRPRTAGNELLDVHADARTGQDQLKVLIAQEEIAKRLKIERLLEKLPAPQKEAFTLRRNGLTIDKIVETTGVSRAQINRYIRQTKAYLAEALSAQLPK